MIRNSLNACAVLYAVMAVAHAQTEQGSTKAATSSSWDLSAATFTPARTLFASLPPAAANINVQYLVTDCATTACVGGGGIVRALKVSDGVSWTTISGSLTLCGTSGDFQILDPLTGVGCQPGGINQVGRNGTGNASMNAQSTFNWQTPSVPTFNSGGTTTCDYSLSNACWVKFVGGNTTLAITNGGNGPLLLITRADNTSRAFTAVPGTAVGIAGPPNEANKDQFQVLYFTGSGGYQAGAISCPACLPALYLPGSTSGAITIKAPAVAGSNTLTLPAGTTDFSATGGASQVVKQISAGAPLTVGQLGASDLTNGVSGSGAICLVTGSACGAGGGGYRNSCGFLAATMSGADVVMCTMNTATLASGRCWTITLHYQGSAAGGNITPIIKIDGTTAITIGAQTQDYHEGQVIHVCNDPSSTTAQHYSFWSGWYVLAANYANGNTPSNELRGGSGTLAINFGSSHTITITLNQGSGTATLWAATLEEF